VLVTVQANEDEQKHLYAYYTKHTPGDQPITEALLRNYLVTRLPNYMIPVHFIQLEKMPLTSNGKVDIRALPKIKNDTPAEKRGPENELEMAFLITWKDILQANEMDVMDNFFELGGDSIKAAQIASRLSEKGIAINVKDILMHQTIEQISLHAECIDLSNSYEQGIVKGEKRLSPVECWLFNWNLVNPNYFNQSVLLTLHKKTDKQLLEKAFDLLIERHDALRINYDKKRHQLFYNENHLKKQFNIEQYILHAEDRNMEFVGICERIKNSFDITETRLLNAALIKDDKQIQLFITAHHLIIDGFSWRILLEDLYTIYDALEKAAPIRLPQKTATLIDWERKLIDHSVSAEMEASATYWQDIADTHFTIPVDAEITDWKMKDSGKKAGHLNREKTDFLLKKAQRRNKTDVPVFLNLALLLTLHEWSAAETFVIEQENHGRHLQSIDTSRTVGWFTAMYPVKLKLINDTLGNQLKSIQEQMQAIPDHGLGYGIGYYFKKQVNTENKITELRFNYLGQFDKELNNDFFSYNNRSTGLDSDPLNAMTAKLEFNSMIIGGELNLEIIYHTKAHRAPTIDLVVDLFFNKLEIVLAYVEKQNDLHFTPSDFDTVQLDQKELDALFE
jgi:non-ribosomal peptide synthase protein (TIGR01720 family)